MCGPRDDGTMISSPLFSLFNNEPTPDHRRRRFTQRSERGGEKNFNFQSIMRRVSRPYTQRELERGGKKVKIEEVEEWKKSKHRSKVGCWIDDDDCDSMKAFEMRSLYISHCAAPLFLDDFLYFSQLKLLFTRLPFTFIFSALKIIERDLRFNESQHHQRCVTTSLLILRFRLIKVETNERRIVGEKGEKN